MRMLLAFVLVVTCLVSTKVFAYLPFDQCIDNIQHNIDFCEATYKNDPSYANYELVPIHVVGSPVLDTNGRYYFYLNGGCRALAFESTTLCDTHSPNTIRPPQRRPNGRQACESGSKIRVDEMSVAEEVPLVGIPFNLIYTSERTLGNSKTYQTTFGFEAIRSLNKSSSVPATITYYFTYAFGRQGSFALQPGQS